MDNRNKFSIYLTIVILLIVGGIFIFSNIIGINVKLESDKLVVDGLFFKEEIIYENIESIEIVDDIEYGYRTFGSDFIMIKSGDFKNQMFGNYKLCTYSDNKTNIAIFVNNQYVVFNLKTINETENLYHEIKNIIDFD